MPGLSERLFHVGLETKHREEIDKHAAEILERELRKESPEPDTVHAIVYWLEGAQSLPGVTKNEKAISLLEEMARNPKVVEDRKFEEILRWANAALHNILKRELGEENPNLDIVSKIVNNPDFEAYERSRDDFKISEMDIISMAKAALKKAPK